MKFKTFFLSLAFFLSHGLAHASSENRRSQISDLIKKDLARMWLLGQATDNTTFARLPKEILNLIGQDLKASEAVLLTNGADRKWVYFEELAPEGVLTDEHDAWSFVDPISALALFHRRNVVSEATIRYYLERQKEIKSALLDRISANWLKDVKSLVSKQQRQDDKTWHPSKAYIAGLLAYFKVVHTIAYLVPDHLIVFTDANVNRTLRHGAWRIAPDKVRNAAKAATVRAYNLASFAAAKSAAKEAIDAAHMDAYLSVENSTRGKLKVLDDKENYSDNLEIGSALHDLGVLFSLFWLTENGHATFKRVFNMAYAHCPATIGVDAVKEAVEAKLSMGEVHENALVHAFQQDLAVLEKAVLAD